MKVFSIYSFIYGIIIYKEAINYAILYFLGVGTLPEGYEEALYSFEDNKEEIHASKYVQSAIIEKFQSDISEVFVFCTEKSYSLGARNIKNEIKTKFNIDIKFITINEFVKIEEILQK